MRLQLTFGLASLAACLAAAAPAVAKPKGAFIGPGTYSPADGCQKFAKLAAGILLPNIENYPEKLTADGFYSWEGGCTFLTVRKLRASVWVTRMFCAEGSVEERNTTTFVKLKGDRWRVTGNGGGLTYKRCKSAKE